MADSKLIDRVKTCLRLTTALFDDNEIEPMIEACFQDMRGAGVNISSADRALIEQTVIFYCKAYFGSNADRDSWAKHYEKSRDSMASRACGGEKSG